MSSIRSPQGLPMNLWHPIRRRSSSRSSRSLTLLGTPETTALSAVARAFTILAVRRACHSQKSFRSQARITQPVEQS